jgi:putative phage-type endonuclease
MTQMNPLEQIEDATHLGTFESGSKEWHDLRNQGIGGSLVGTIAGLNKWESAYTAWAKYTGKIDSEIPDSPAMEWGRRLESVVLDKFKDSHPELEVLEEVGTWQNKERAYQIANPDGIAMDEHGNLTVIEIKTARFPDDWEKGVPLYYLTQVQWYLSCLGIQQAYVAVLIGGSDYREFYVEADHFQQQADIALVQRFLMSVKFDQAPDWDGSQSTYESVRQMNPNIQDRESELGDLGAQCLAAIEKENAAKAEALALKSQVLDRMGNAKRGLVNDKHVFSRQSRGSGAPFLVVKKGQ